MLPPSLYEAVFNGALSGNCLLTPSADPIILAVNEKFIMASGRRRDQLLGEHLFALFPADPDDSMDTGEAALRCSLARVIASGKPETLEVQRYPIQVKLPSGELIYEERYWTADNNPIFSEDGKLLCISHTTRDITDRVRSEMTVRENERLFRALSIATADVIYRMSPDWAEMHQLDGRGFLKDTSQPHLLWLDEYIPVEERERVSSAVADAINSKSVFELEHRVRRLDGSYGWTLSRAVPLLDEKGEITEWIGAASDITERRQVEARYRTLFASIDEGFCIIDMLFDVDGRPCNYRFCEVNPAFETHTGLHNAVGKTVRELNPHHEQHWVDIYAEVLRKGQTRRFENHSPSLDRWFDVYAFRLEDNGAPKVAVLFKDVSEQKRAYREASESEHRAVNAAWRAEEAHRRLVALLQAAPVGIAMSDIDGSMVLSNAEHNRLWGGHPPIPQSVYDYADWKGWWADGSEHQGQRLMMHEWATARALNGEDVRYDTVEIETFGDSPVSRTILVSGSAVRSAAGDIIGAAIVEMDVSERVKAEKALRAADRKKDEFLAMLAHELRNPLAPISAAADLLAMDSLDEARIKRTSNIISRQTKHIVGLVDDLLDVSRVTRGLVKLKKERLDVRQIVFEAMEQVRPLVEARRHHMVMHAPPGSASVMGDRHRLVQVVANLLSNSAKYTPEGGHIAVAVEVAADAVIIDVTDDGIGMEPELIAHAFELFAQANRTSDRSQGGLGIGLALVKSLVELHGGGVTARSEGLGKGSKFIVSLPNAGERSTTVGADPLQSPIRVSAALKILIVDDNQDAAQMLAMYLEAIGHDVVVEHGACEALQRAISECPQVCLLDIGLPGMDGNELAQRLRKQPETAASVLVAISGYGQDNDRAISRVAGFDHYFVKPIDTLQLSEMLNQLGAANKDS
jgi:PAS domain S-box-containing protein